MKRRIEPEWGRLPILLGSFVVLLCVLSAGPLFALALPAGPGGLLAPAPVAVGISSGAFLFCSLAWPLVCRHRTAGAVSMQACAQVLFLAPFVAGAGLAAGLRNGALARVALTFVAALAVNGAFLVGPGRSGRRDRLLLGGWIVLAALLPLANYAANEFFGIDVSAGYALSPVLGVRREILGLPGPGLAPFLVLCGVTAALLLLLRRRSGVAAVLAVIALCATSARSADVRVRPLLGPSYVPGRAVPLLVEGAGDAARVRVFVSGRGEYDAPVEGSSAVLLVPGEADLARVNVALGNRAPKTVSVTATPLPAGRRLLAVLGPARPALRAAARSAGFVVSRCAAGAESRPAVFFLSADAVYDPAGLLPPKVVEKLDGAGISVLSSVGSVAGVARSVLRRPWEEASELLSPDELDRMFAPAPPYDRRRSEVAWLMLVGFAVVGLLLLRLLVRRRASPAFAVVGLMVPSAVVLFLLVFSLPPTPPVRGQHVVVRRGGLEVRVSRYTSGVGGVVRSETSGLPLVLGGKSSPTVDSEGGGRFSLTLPLRANEERIVASVGFGPPVREGRAFDVVLGPRGLAVPGGEYLSAARFLETEMTGRSGELSVHGWRLTKLFDLGRLPERARRIRFLDSPSGSTIVVTRPNH